PPTPPPPRRPPPPPATPPIPPRPPVTVADPPHQRWRQPRAAALLEDQVVVAVTVGLEECGTDPQGCGQRAGAPLSQ
ncbi:MAG: hypothetical protein F4139_08865, partial [Gemmatimonadetes bacterium]|nr:hypothetical protein [Gemmatimonadota bacterium]